jgi:hypothetical protein|tara:strand:- start:480 stop:668 length:189 start_codon:yes stop_codon:yes gene_type:complete
MKLEDWLDKKAMSLSEFGRRIDRNPSTVLRLCQGTTMPSKKTVEAIKAVTGNKVKANDFYHE